MTATKQKLLYSLVALLFVFVIAIIGWLGYLLLAFQREASPSAPSETVASVQRQESGSGPSTETVINVDPLPEPGQSETNQTAAGEAGPTPAEHGHIPCVCEGYGPQIVGRETYENPVTHQTVVSANRAMVTLTLPPAPTGDEAP